jgi:hypothetical protein
MVHARCIDLYATLKSNDEPGSWLVSRDLRTSSLCVSGTSHLCEDISESLELVDNPRSGYNVSVVFLKLQLALFDNVVYGELRQLALYVGHVGDCLGVNVP